MGIDDLSLLRFGAVNFFSILMNRPVWSPSQTLLCELTHSVIESESEPDVKDKERVLYIFQNTDKSVGIPLATVENVVFKNMHKGLSTEVDFSERNRTKTFKIAELYHILSNIRWELVTIITRIAKKYSVEMPIYESGSGKTSFSLNELIEKPKV